MEWLVRAFRWGRSFGPSRLELWRSFDPSLRIFHMTTYKSYVPFYKDSHNNFSFLCASGMSAKWLSDQGLCSFPSTLSLWVIVRLHLSLCLWKSFIKAYLILIWGLHGASIFWNFSTFWTFLKMFRNYNNHDRIYYLFLTVLVFFNLILLLTRQGKLCNDD